MTKRRRQELAEQISEHKDTKPDTGRRDVSVSRIPSGSTLLNCALSDDPFGGFLAGRVVNIIGDRSAGKSLLLHSIYAEVLHNRMTQQYKCVDDDVEAARSFNVAGLWGQTTADGIVPPYYEEDGARGRSYTMEQWRDTMLGMIAEETPFVYGLDSIDNLTCEAELAKLKKDANKKKQGKETGGSFSLERQRTLPEIMRLVVSRLEKTESALFIVSQAREDIGVTFGDRNRRNFGKTLDYEETYELWLAVEETLYKTVNGRKRQIGVRTRVQVKKNRLTGKMRTVSFPIYYSYGLDDVESCVQFLVDEQFWPVEKQTIIGEELDVRGTMPKIISEIEDGNKENQLREVVGRCWNEIEDSLKMNDRKARY